MSGGNALLNTSCWVLSGSFRWNWEPDCNIKHGIMALCGLDLRECRREAVLVHWVDPKPLLRLLLHCHSHCSYCQRGLERGMGCPGAPCPVQADLVLAIVNNVGMCSVLHTGGVMSGVWVLSWLWVSWGSSQESGWACALCWSMLEWPPSSAEVTQPQGCGQCFGTWVAAQGLTYTSLPLWLSLASLAVTHRFLGHHTD